MTRRAPPEAQTFCVESPIDPDWSSIKPRVHDVTARLEAAIGDPALCGMVEMVATELCENAVKHGRWTGPEGAVLVVRRRAAEAGDVIDVEVSSPVEGPADHGIVDRAIAWIRSFPSARDAYVACVLRLLSAGKSGGLGLSRIAHEAGCELAATFSSDDRTLRVTATLPCTEPPDR